MTPEDLHLSAQRREHLVLKFADDRIIAHQTLFGHRHPDQTPLFHDDLVTLWSAPTPKVLVQAFRGAAKSTIAEEWIILTAAMKLAKNILVVGSTYERAADRLRAIKHEFETNEMLAELYGTLVGSVWNEGRIVLASGVCIQSFGKGQQLRGIKYLDARPDVCLVDDLEETDDVRTPEARQETLRWFFSELLPALDNHARLRVAATPLDRESLPMVLARQPGWITRTYPIEHVDAQGKRCATWADRFPLEWIDDRRQEFEQAGMGHAYQQEYMCLPEDPASKTFTTSMFKVESHVHVWQPTFAFYDPARTIKQTSAGTGWAVWSWIGRRLTVWDGGAEHWQPDQIIDHIFKVNEQYHPVKIGVELDGLEQFLLQPLRQAMLHRSVIAPIEGYRAPRGKIQFISSLQPFFAAGEITFVKDIPAIKQFLSFPTGKMDFPNALAYALLMRPGQAVYEDFGRTHVVEELLVHGDAPVFLCLNATNSLTTAVACQFVGKALHILGDWVREGDPGAVVGEIVRDAGLAVGRALKLTAPASHFRTYDTVGLPGAVRRLPAELRCGGDILRGRAELRALLAQQTRGEPALQVSRTARWTLNAFSSGYARTVSRQGMPSEEAGDGLYRVLMEGLESFIATAQVAGEEDPGKRYAFGSDGRRYQTIAPQLAEPFRPTKDEWWRDGPAEPRSILRRQ